MEEGRMMKAESRACVAGFVKLWTHFLCCLPLICVSASLSVSADETTARQQVLVIVGAAGTDEYGRQFREWAGRWERAARSGGADCRIIGLDDGDSADDRSAMCDAISDWKSVDTTEPLWIVLIGHGTYDGRTTRFNLRGKDMTAEETAALLHEATRPVALINCASSSAPFINAASGEGRVIVSATKDGGQFQFARFGDSLSQAISTLNADLDQDSQVSLLEAWAFAAKRTSEFYESEGRLATEHALLDDNGDGLGSRAAVFKGVQLMPPSDQDSPDGSLARRWHLVRSEDERLLSPEQRRQRDDLEEQLEELKGRAAEYAESAYLDELQKILLPLAQLYDDASSDNQVLP